MLRKNRFIKAVIAGLFMAGCAVVYSQGETNLIKTVVTSDSLMFDYGRSTCVFDGDVVVDDPRVKMECEKLYIFFDATNSVDSIVATGSVKVWQGDKRGVCDKAVYTEKTGAIVMTGSPKLQSGNSLVRGTEIKIFVNSEKVISTPKARLVVFPSESKNFRKKPGQ